MIPTDFPFIPSRGSESAPHAETIVEGAHWRRLEDVVYHVGMRRFPARPASFVAKLIGSADGMTLRQAVLPLEQDLEVWASFVLVNAPEGAVRAVTVTIAGESRTFALTSVVTTHTRVITVRSPVVPAGPAAQDISVFAEVAPGPGDVGVLEIGTRSMPLRVPP
jgi:hypothetical protein